MKYLMSIWCIVTCFVFSFTAHAQQQPLAKSPKYKTTAFLKWYISNKTVLDELNSNITGLIGDSTRPYKVDYNKVEMYLKKIKNSGYVTDFYIHQIRLVFKKSDENLTKYRQWDGPIYGLEWD